jgi:hypothetical protein
MALSYFAGGNVTDQQLEFTDGTVAGTKVVGSFINSGSILELTTIGSRLFFLLFDGPRACCFWIYA